MLSLRFTSAAAFLPLSGKSFMLCAGADVCTHRAVRLDRREAHCCGCSLAYHGRCRFSPALCTNWPSLSTACSACTIMPAQDSWWCDTLLQARVVTCGISWALYTLVCGGPCLVRSDPSPCSSMMAPLRLDQ